MARWVATFRAAIDRPVAADASLSDISFNFTILIACRCSGGRRSNSVSKRGFVEIRMIKVRRNVRKGFMFGRKGDFSCLLPGLPAEPIDDTPVGNRQKPRSEWTSGIVSMANHVNCHQYILHSVFRVARLLEAAPRNRTDIGRQIFKQGSVGTAVAILRARHELRPVAPAIRPSGILRRRNRHEGQRRRAAMPAGHHKAPYCEEPFPSRFWRSRYDVFRERNTPATRQVIENNFLRRP